MIYYIAIFLKLKYNHTFPFSPASSKSSIPEAPWSQGFFLKLLLLCEYSVCVVWLVCSDSDDFAVTTCYSGNLIIQPVAGNNVGISVEPVMWNVDFL